ncbi:MAG: hypothetical protein ACXABI_17045 [Candidatus Hodarchaeales archaeon]|jgi:hypothetical protein
MLNAEDSSSSPVQFFLAHIIFDEEHGPLLKSYMAHEIEIPKIILQGVTTTLGRVLIHSFAIDDPSARGKNRIESFMLFIPRSHQDKLLQHSYAFSNVLQNAIDSIQVNSKKNDEDFSLSEIFTNIKKILMTRIDNIIQDQISAICTDKEAAIVSDGTVRAIHNIVLTPEIISLVDKIPILLNSYGDQLKQFGTFFDALPIEIHGKTLSNQQFYLITIENIFILAFSSGKGRLGSLFRSFREIVWDLNIQSSTSPSIQMPTFSPDYQELTKKYSENEFLNVSFEILKNFTPIITNASLLRCNNNVTKIDALKLTDSEAGNKHAFVCAVFTIIHELCNRLFRTSLIQMVLSQHGFNSVALLWAESSSKKSALYLVGDSIRGAGLLKLVGDQILEHKTKLYGMNETIHLKLVRD